MIEGHLTGFNPTSSGFNINLFTWTETHSLNKIEQLMVSCCFFFLEEILFLFLWHFSKHKILQTQVNKDTKSKTPGKHFDNTYCGGEG